MSKRPRDARPAHAVIDIGSNTVRLVIYGGPPRAPISLFNEKTTARLGRDLSAEGGEMPDKAIDQALRALARFVLVIADYGVKQVQTVATAAVRDATNGEAFLHDVAALGLSPRLLSGEEEARASADGVISAFPGARGVVADLGGGSIELIAVEGGTSHHGVSLPLGTLRLPALREKGSDRFRKAVHKAFEGAGWAATHPGPLYLVGGTWRAFAAFAMYELDWPLSDPHAFRLSAEDALRFSRKAAKMDAASLAAIPGVATSRSAALPHAAEMLRIMLSELEPDGLVFSSWGLREGLLYQQLGLEERANDPLLAGVIAFAAPRQGAVTEATQLAAWAAPVVSGDGPESERLRLAATLLALALGRVEPNLRVRQGLEWALDKRWIAIDARGRAMLAAALLAACGKTDHPAGLAEMASEADLREATGWGLSIRLARRAGAAALTATLSSALQIEKGKLVLTTTPERAPIVGESVIKDLGALAEWFGLEPEVRVAG